MEYRQMVQLLREEFPSEYFFDVRQMLRGCYKGSKEEVKANYDDQEAADCVYAIRRAKIESSFFNLPQKYPSIQSRRVRNSSGNSHVEVFSKNFTMVLNYCKEADGQISDAVFRQGYAVANQCELFRATNGSDQETKMKYVIIKHGSAQFIPEAPEYINIEFPVPPGTSKIPVMPLAELIRMTPSSGAVETIIGTGDPKLKKSRETGTDTK